MENLPAVQLASDIEAILINGDIASLEPVQRIAYTKALCESFGLNFLTRPFQFISFDGKVQLYATRACAEQLREQRKISIKKVEKRIEDEFLYCDVTVTDGSGREDTDTAVIWLREYKKKWNGSKMVREYENGQPITEPLVGDSLANAHMKVVTKAKRRATLAFCALGIPDESEIETIDGAKVGRDALAATISTAPEPTDDNEPTGHKFYYNVKLLPEDKQKVATQMALASGAEYDEGTMMYASPVHIRKLQNALVEVK